MNYHRLIVVAGAFVGTAALFSSQPAHAIFLDGSGHYSLRGATKTNPGMRDDTGTYQAIEQNFSLDGEARLNDRSSFMMQLKLFDESKGSYLGDTGQSKTCPPRRVVKSETQTGPDTYSRTYTIDESCEGRSQDGGDPGYVPFQPQITEAYVRYAFDYCLLEAGRRSRDWGLGIFMSSGRGMFDRDASRYDGFDCYINPQKSQTIGLRFGYDKLAETGAVVETPYDVPRSEIANERAFDATKEGFGPNRGSDDLDQYFFSIEFDDRKANAGAAFTKNIGLYFASISSAKDNPAKTDLKYADLYTGLFFPNLSVRNELLIRLGKSADPNWVTLGGKLQDEEGRASNNLQGIGLAGDIDYTLSRSGAVIGPAEYRQGNAVRHALFLSYAYAPGSDNGYYKDPYDVSSGAAHGDLRSADVGAAKRESKTASIAFHRNYHPALLLFNANPGLEYTRVDGAYDPGRVLNATLFAIGYHYESLENGNFEAKFLTGRLNKVAPAVVKDDYTRCYRKVSEMSAEDNAYCASIYAENPPEERPVGFFGGSLGYELDLAYTRSFGKELDLGASAGYLLPGNAFKLRDSGLPPNTFVLQTFAGFKF